MITLIGVGHVFRIREVVEQLIGERAPQVVGVELDEMRYEALLTQERGEDVELLLKLLMKAQENIAKSYGAPVGEEMLSAIDTAMTMDIQAVFIDIPADKSVKPLLKSLGVKEKLYLGGSAVAALFIPKKGVEKMLKKYDENPQQMMDAMEKEMPSLKKALVDDRDKYMARALIHLNKKFPDVVAVIGDGHVPGITKILRKSKIRPETIRLKEVRKLAERTPQKETPEHKMLGKEKLHRIRFSYTFKQPITL